MVENNILKKSANIAGIPRVLNVLEGREEDWLQSVLIIIKS